MKPKTPKQKRSEPIELDGQILVTEITKNAFGWIARATCTTGVPSEPAIQTSNPFVAKLTKEDFDRLQPGDQIRFLAVVTRPRKAKVKNTEASKDIESAFNVAIAAEVAG